MSFTLPKKDKLTGILAIILYLAAGLLLLFRPDMISEVMHWTVTAVLGIYALIRTVRYFRMQPAEAARGYNLTAALIAATLALLSFINTSWLTSRLWGLLLLCGGYMKFQTAWDFYRLGHSRWWWIMIGAAISLIFGALIMTEVITGNLAIWVGIAMLVEAILDAAVLIIVAKADTLNKPAHQKKETDAPAAEAADESADRTTDAVPAASNTTSPESDSALSST